MLTQLIKCQQLRTYKLWGQYKIIFFQTNEQKLTVTGYHLSVLMRFLASQAKLKFSDF